MNTIPSDSQRSRPRIGVPYRAHKEELSGERRKYESYLESVRRAGGTPVEISLRMSRAELQSTMRELDGIVLPGSPADVNPARYGSVRHAKTADADETRERTDLALLEHCAKEGKPVLAICYGVQILNVYFEGSLIQDIAAEVPGSMRHSWEGTEQATESFHEISIERGSKMDRAAGNSRSKVNSSHHQAIREPGRDLRVTVRASDGIIEAVEWTGDQNWIVGVQWHPERMADDSLSQELFHQLVSAARHSAVRA